MKWITLVVLALPAIISAQKAAPIRMPPIDNEDIDTRVIPKSYYTVVAPYDIRQGYSYNVYVRGFYLKKSVRLILKINGTSNAGSPIDIKETVVISSENSKASISISTSKIPPGTYAFFVESDKFAERRSLTYITKRYSLFTFMNKAIFKPNELVQFKILAVNSETKSVTPKCSNVLTITDPNGNMIESVQNVTFVSGKYASEFQLSKKAGLGVWNLQIQCDDETYTKEFEVAEYTLPLVIGTLSVAQSTPFSYGKIPIAIDVSYANSGVASGNATITIEKYGQKIYKRDITITSNNNILDVDIVKDLQVTTAQYADFQAYLVFYDQLSGNKVTDTKSFQVIPNVYWFAVESKPVLKPGTPYTFTIAMKKFDGSPAPVGSKISVIVTYPDTIPTQILKLGDDGTVECTVDVPADTRTLSIQLTAKNTDNGYVGASVPYRRSGEYLNIDRITLYPKINEKAKIKITSSENIDFVILHAVCQGVLIESTRVWFDDDSEEEGFRTAYYSIRTSLKCIPTLQVLVYYINEKGNFVTATTHIKVQNLGNYLEITPQKDQVGPGAEVNLEVESNIGSTVSLCAVDQRVVTLRGGHNVTHNDVYNDIGQYAYNNVIYDFENVASYEYVFGESGLFIFTNIPRPPIRYYKGRPGRPEPMDRPAAPDRREPEKAAKDTKTSDTKIRDDFRDSFLWTDVKIKNNKYPDESDEYSSDYWKGIETVSVNATQELTTYLIYGISMSKYDGMGLLENIPSVKVFMPFSVNLELPYSVKKEEVLQLDIILFNFLKNGQFVEVRIKKDPKFDAVDLKKNGWKEITGFYSKNITTEPKKHVKLEFFIRPKVIGFVPIEITAKGPLAGDGIRKQLRVIQQGVPRYITTSAMIALDTKSGASESSTTLSCKLPDSAYLDTAEISSTVVGDIFGKALDNLDRLIRMPGGCGEQTMLDLAPIIAIMKYLNAANKMTPTTKAKLEQYIKGGYQNELTYQRTDGSFSAFGNSDSSGSTWLSAYVAKYFFYAKNFVTIDSNVIKRAADFVVAQQNSNGAFNEVGRVIHVDMQGGGGQGVSLTAYCATFLTTILADYPDYTSIRDKAIVYLENIDMSSLSTYELGVVTHTLVLAGSSKATQFFNAFNAKKTEESQTIFWSVPAPPNPNFWYYNEPRSTDIELTSYGLLIYNKRGVSLSKIMKIVNYHVSKANDLGGYSSSQDTVMAFESLSEVASTFSQASDVALELTPNFGYQITTTVDSTNAFTLQHFDLNASTRKLKVSATTNTSGIAVVSLICHFYEDPTKVVPVFNITYTFGYSCNYRINFDVCTNYIPTGASGMALLTATMPSGFVYDEWFGMKNPDVSKVEIMNQGSKVVFYFNSIGVKQTCVNINAYRANNVADLKGGTLEVVDYYDTSKQGSTSYPVPDLNSQCYYYMPMVR